MELTGKVALVTGSAKRLGRAIALALGRAGANVLVHYNRSRDEAEKTAGEIRALGVQAVTHKCDLADAEQIAGMFRAVNDRFGRLDVLVNSASVFYRTRLGEVTPRQWEELMTINARAPLLCMQHAAALMADRGQGGCIVNITDISAERPWAGYPAYCASKAALKSLTESAAKALAARRIRVNAVAPGMILPPAGTSPQTSERLIRRAPLGRSGRPEEVASAVIFLAENDYVTGQTIRVDGGWGSR